MRTPVESTVPVVVLATTDPVLRDVALLTGLLDAPGAVAIVHDFSESTDGDFVLSRRVLSGLELSAETLLDLAHPCVGCAMREDAVPAIAEAIERGASSIVLALPLDAEFLPATRTLLAEARPGGRLPRIHLGHTVTVCASSAVESALLDGDDALMAQLVGADVVVVDGGDAHAVGSDLIDALRWRASMRHDDISAAWLPAAIKAHHDDAALEVRCDPVTVQPGRGFARGRREPDGAIVAPSGVWLMRLRSPRPVHPARLLALGDQLAPETSTSRGRFTVPSRPDWVCGWDAVGGSVAVGLAGPGSNGTCLIVTGTGDRDGIQRAFRRALLTDEELARPLRQWQREPDPLAPYLDGTGASDAA